MKRSEVNKAVSLCRFTAGEEFGFVGRTSVWKNCKIRWAGIKLRLLFCSIMILFSVCTGKMDFEKNVFIQMYILLPKRYTSSNLHFMKFYNLLFLVLILNGTYF